MKPNINEIFDKCIEAIEGGQSTVEDCLSTYSEIRAELEPMLAAVIKLNKAGRIAPDARRKQDARARLMEAVEQKRWEAGVERKAVPTGLKRLSKWRTGFARLVAITAIFMLLSGTTLAFARESMPGSILYPVKIAFEKAKIGLTMDRVAKSKLYLSAAQERISELKRLKDDDAHYEELVAAVAENIQKAGQTWGRDHSEEFEDVLADMAGKNKEVLKNILDKVPPSAKPALERAIENSEKASEKPGKVDKDTQVDTPVKPKTEQKPKRDNGNKNSNSNGNRGRSYGTTPSTNQERENYRNDSYDRDSDEEGLNKEGQDRRTESSNTKGYKM
ncbi:MAG: DUF5667 domain-containing protein [Firmicutes bacterium]|nr:DUF5667 domain-containing protein [Bacillota bacterium]